MSGYESDPGSPRKYTGRQGRFYEWRGENYWSVTTIINGGMPKPALINWAKRFTAEYAIDNLELLRQMVAPKADGFVDREGAVAWLKEASFRDRDRAAALGTQVHQAIEAYTLGAPFPEWAPAIRTRMLAFERWLARYEPSYDAGMTEAAVYSRSQRYAGTLDTVFTIGRGKHKGRRALNDYKSGGKDVYPEAALQLAAYRNAEFVGAPDGSEQPLPEVDLTTVLWMPDGGDCQLIEVATDQEVFNAFLYTREVYRWQLETSKRVVVGWVSWEEPGWAPDTKAFAEWQATGQHQASNALDEAMREAAREESNGSPAHAAAGDQPEPSPLGTPAEGGGEDGAATTASPSLLDDVGEPEPGRSAPVSPASLETT